jgi:hypothetical protein
MATRPHDISFVIPGQTQAGGATRGSSKVSVRVGVQRGGTEPVRVIARPGEDVVVLSIANGPTLYLHPQDARDLMRAQSAGASRSAVNAADDNEVMVSPQLGWPGLEAGATRGATRGWLGQAALSAFELITGLAKDPAAQLTAAVITKKVDGAVDAGVYELSVTALAPLKGSGRKRDAVPATADGGPLLVLVHGTFVDSVSTFGQLWTQHPQTVRELFQHYGDRVYALDHPTLGHSPIANALTLVRAMPAGARLHLLTHSRGGLVAEVLARACGGKPPGSEALALFAGADYRQQRTDLQALAQEAMAKGLKIERLVRVACPARGTLLASKRLDAYLSVLKWSLELGGVPVAPQLLDFLIEVARRRTQPDELPGLEAMMPESPLVQWLNGAGGGSGGGETLPGELRVVAGDLEGDSIGSWVKTLLSDAFYWTDNDLIVQTRSMYGGAARAASATGATGAGASFVLDRGAKVSHFNYFANESTVKAITAALLEATPADFATIGPLSWAGEDASGSRAARAAVRSRGADATDAANRPAVFVLPGILGSNLKLDGKRIWLGFRFINGLKKLAWDPATAARIEPDGPIGSTYDELIERLADSHEVIPFAYDWRRPIEDEAQRLAAAVDAALAARNTSQQPVRLLAHSMGGLLARTMRLEKPDTWARLMAREGARLVMLGTPNGGSWAPMQTLSGDDTFGNALVAFGALFDNGGARKMMAGLPGFIQLQAALLDPRLGLDKASTWQKLADEDMAALRERSLWHDEGAQRTIYEWGAPPQEILDQAVQLRRRLDAQLETLGPDAPKMLLVVGHASFTPAGITQTADGLEYLDAPDDGDGRVTLASALLPGVRTWKVDAEHGKLPDVASAFAAYIELLDTGQTAQLEVLEPAPPGVRGTAGAAAAGAPLVRNRPSRGLQSSRPPSSQADVWCLARSDSEARGARAKGTALRVSVYNGDLKFVSQPLLVGHYRSLVLTGTEWVVDGLVGHAMSQSLAAGLYPDATGSHHIFGNQRPDPDNVFAMARPQAVVVAGLGEEGKLRASELVYTVRQAVLAYAQRVSEQGGVAQFELAATLIGSGGTGISAGSAAQLIAQGVFEASQKLLQSGWPQLSRLILVEFYLDRASDAWRALQVQSIATPNQLELVGLITSGDGALRRSLDSSYRGAAYDLISALTGPRDSHGQPTIQYVLDTRRARTEVRAQQAQGTLLNELVAKASNDANRDAQIGRTLFKLLVPVEMEPFLGGTTEMLIELDAGSAVIPWELLDTDAPAHSGGDPRPWAIRSKLLRKLRTEDFRAQVSDANADDSVLVIGEPQSDPTRYPPLPGARAEAIAVVTRLTSATDGLQSGKVRALVSGADDARSVINALFERPYRVVHVAGHGAPGARGGVVLSGDTFLGAAEIKAMRTVPELVFLNCCHLAGRDASLTLQPYDRASFAATIAQALIEVGVRCVIAAGWAVEDGPAEKFATTFYAVLLRGERFIDAVAAAREAAWRESPQGNTWAAYQCYGDPGWTWQRGGANGVDGQRKAPPVGDEFAAVSSPVALALALETLAIRSRFSTVKAEAQRDKLHFLESKFAPPWGAMGAVAEAFGLAYAQAKDSAKAIDWYRVAVNAADGSASFRAAEQLGDALAHHGETLSDETAAREMIEEGIAQLSRLVALQATLERESLLGSAWKRLVLLEARAGHDNASLKALEKMAAHYAHAETLARQVHADNLFDPAKNGIGAELRLAFLQQRAPRLAEDRLDAVRESLDRAATEKPDFWSVVGQTELGLLEALAQGRLAGAGPGLMDAFRALKLRVPALSNWETVYTETRFTLEPYQAVASATESRAAVELLKGLKALATA